MENTVIIRDEQSKLWLQFENPLEVYKTNRTEEVVPLLKKVEDQVEKGLYAAGFVSYEAASAFDPALKTKKTNSFPLIWFCIYEQVKALNLPQKQMSLDHSLKWEISSSQNEYIQAFQRIKDYLQAGATYQVNYTLRKEAKFNTPPWEFFLNMIGEAPFGAFIDCNEYTICSASPELFFHYENGRIISRPMKGTIQRGKTLEEDQHYQQQLFHSQKDRSENIMIVDMIRNDIGRIAETGTVQVSKLFEIEKYPTLWQMTSTVEAKTNKSIAAIFAALFPCASITGAPKASAMQIINELETSPRKIYTGSIGFITPQKRMQFNVAIRTALIDKQKGKIEYGAGGGIVWDSNAEKEYQECLLKTKILENHHQKTAFNLLETLLWTPEEDYFLLKEHLERLSNTAQYFNYPLNLNAIKKDLENLVANFKNHAYKVRLLVNKDGKSRTEFSKLGSAAEKGTKVVCLAESPIDSTNPFLFHKTTNRSIYNDHLEKHKDYHDVLLWNEEGVLTEACNANIVVRWKGQLLTPPVHCGLLNGTFRTHLMQKGVISEANLPVEKLPDFEAIYLINSVRKWVQLKPRVFKYFLNSALQLTSSNRYFITSP